MPIEHVTNCIKEDGEPIKYVLDTAVDAGDVATLEAHMETHADVISCTVSGVNVSCTLTATGDEGVVQGHLYLKLPDLT